MGPGSTSVIQVTNIAPIVTNEQLRTLFTNVGAIREFVVYPTNDPSQQVSKVCYVRFIDPMNVCVAQHLTSTVFIDRAIMVKPVSDNRIPDETMALKLANEGHSQNSSNSGVVSQIETVNGAQSITTIDPRLNALGLPQYPALSPSLDPTKIEEIRRTILVSNVNKQTTPEDILQFFNQFGEVKYLRMTTNENDVIKSAMIEYTDQSSVANALQMTGTTLHGSQLNITHSTTSILKPQYKINVDPEKFVETQRDLKRRSRSRSHRRSRSPKRRSRSPIRSRERRRSLSGSRSPRPRRRSKSRERVRSPYSRRRSSRERESRERRIRREKERSIRDRERDRDRRRLSRDRSLERRRSPFDRDRDRDRRRRERSREKDYVRIGERPKERDRLKKRERSRSSERKHRSRHKDGRSSDIHRKSRSPSEMKIKLVKSPPPIDREEKEHHIHPDPPSDHNDDMMDIDDDTKLSKKSMDLENSSVKSEHSSQPSSPSPVAPLSSPNECGISSSNGSKHHRSSSSTLSSSSSSKHKLKHQQKIKLTKDYDSD